MAQYIKNANIFGRIGSSAGQALSEQVPKEVEHYRRARDLQAIGKKDYKDPFQAFTDLASAYGSTPQTIQTGGELLKQRGIRNAFARQGEPQMREEISASPGERLRSQQFGGERLANRPQAPDNIQRSVVQGSTGAASDATRDAEAKSQPGIVTENPTKEKFIPPIRWTPEQKREDIARTAERYPHLSYDELKQISDDSENRYLNSPEDYRKQQDYLKSQEDLASNEFDKQLQTALQKEGKDTYSDLTGDTQLDLKKSMYNDLATDPNLTPRTAAEKWIKIGKDFAHTKNEVKRRANRSILDKVFPSTKEENIKSLVSAQKTYAKLGKEREFYNMLRSTNDPETGSFGYDASPGGAALIAYPRSEPIKDLIKNQSKKFRPPRLEPIGKVSEISAHNSKTSRKFAEDFANSRSKKDSILAAARQAKDTYPYFDEVAFFDHLRENQDEYGFTPEQRDELVTGIDGIKINWGDHALFPIFGGRSAAHD